jgi:hypothetical protein
LLECLERGQFIDQHIHSLCTKVMGSKDSAHDCAPHIAVEAMR